MFVHRSVGWRESYQKMSTCWQFNYWKPLVETRAHVCCERRCQLIHLCNCKGILTIGNVTLVWILIIQDLFITFEFISCVEMTLGGDVQLSVVDRLKWNVGTLSVFPGMITSSDHVSSCDPYRYYRSSSGPDNCFTCSHDDPYLYMWY